MHSTRPTQRKARRKNANGLMVQDCSNESEFYVKSTLSLNLIRCTTGTPRQNPAVQFQKFSLANGEQRTSSAVCLVLIPDFMNRRTGMQIFLRGPPVARSQNCFASRTDCPYGKATLPFLHALFHLYGKCMSRGEQRHWPVQRFM